MPVDLFHPEIWKKHGFGLLRKRQLLDVTFNKNREEFLEKWLKKSRLFRSLLKEQTHRAPSHFRVLNIIGNTQKTLASAYLNTENGQLLFDPKEIKASRLDHAPLYEPGDETVTAASAALPGAFLEVGKTIEVESAHDKLFLDPKAESEYKLFLSSILQ